MQLIYLHNLLDVAVNRACAIIVHHTDICTLAQKLKKKCKFLLLEISDGGDRDRPPVFERKNLLAGSFLMERAFSKSQRSAL